MFDQLVQQFMNSDACKQAVKQLTGQGLNDTQARDAVNATVEGAAAQLGQNAGQGGGGLGGMAGALGGLGGATAGGIPQPAMDAIANQVATRTGLSPTISRTVVNSVVPKILEFVKNNMGVAGAP